MPDDTPHRREFVRRLALAGAAVSLPAAAPAAETIPDDDPPTKSEVDARMEWLLARFPDHMADDESRAAVRRDVEAVVRRARALRAFPLENGDAPLPVFRPYRDPLI